MSGGSGGSGYNAIDPVYLNVFREGVADPLTLGPMSRLLASTIIEEWDEARVEAYAKSSGCVKCAEDFMATRGFGSTASYEDKSGKWNCWSITLRGVVGLVIVEPTPDPNRQMVALQERMVKAMEEQGKRPFPGDEWKDGDSNDVD